MEPGPSATMRKCALLHISSPIPLSMFVASDDGMHSNGRSTSKMIPRGRPITGTALPLGDRKVVLLHQVSSNLKIIKAQVPLPGSSWLKRI